MKTAFTRCEDISREILSLNDDGDGNENVKKNNRFVKQNYNFVRASYLFVHFLTVTARLRREMPNFTVYGGR